LTYTNDEGRSNSINVLAIDTADDGFKISKEAMDALTGNLASELWRISVTSKQVAVFHCGF
jgi:hypothetical protein